MIAHLEYQDLIQKLQAHRVSLIAVSKSRSIAEIKQLYAYGQRDFGENYVQELVEKYKALPKNIRWHMIGHLQTNKVQHIVPFISMTQSVDSLKLLSAISREATKQKRTIDCLLEVKIAQEATKSGGAPEEVPALIAATQKLPDIKVSGLMGIASQTSNTAQIRQEFTALKKLFDQFKIQRPEFNVLSMGMSQDYQIAVDEGSTMVRLGNYLFN